MVKLREKKKSGRPIGSEIRQNIVELLSVCGKAYGYELYQYYLDIFPKCTGKSIYYHLKKGLDTGEFLLEDVKCEKGNFSWGGSVERKYFIVGPHAKVTGNPKVKEYFKRKARRKRK